VIGEVEMEDICVAHAHRWKGIAKALITDLIKRSIAHSADYILLEVASSNTQARNLYESLGFELVTIRKAYYTLANNTHDDALLLRKMLWENTLRVKFKSVNKLNISEQNSFVLVRIPR
jgi:ribosomal-protein-alanine N-acetyltransferase